MLAWISCHSVLCSRVFLSRVTVAFRSVYNINNLLFICFQWGRNNTQNEYKYPTIFVLHKTGLTGFLALRVHAKKTKNGEQCLEIMSIIFANKNAEVLPDFDLFETNMFEEDSPLDEDISSFIKQNRNVNTTKKTKNRPERACGSAGASTGSPSSMLAIGIDLNLRQCMRIYQICSKCDIFEKPYIYIYI